MYMCVLICIVQFVSKYYQAILHHIAYKQFVSNIIKQFYITLHKCINPEHTLCAKHDIVTFKVHGSIFLILGRLMISSQDGTVQEGCDSTVSHTRASVLFISL